MTEAVPDAVNGRFGTDTASESVTSELPLKTPKERACHWELKIEEQA
jgi:hypothetical protein